MFDPLTIGVGVLLWSAFRKQSNTQFGALTPEREEIYKNAMEYCHDPRKLVELASEFEKDGLKAQAHVLRARGQWRGRKPETKAQHDAIFAKALQSDNVSAILEVAKIFESMTASVKAGQLRERAKSLVDAKKRIVEEAKSAPSNGAADMSGHTPSKDENGRLPQNPAAS